MFLLKEKKIQAKQMSLICKKNKEATKKNTKGNTCVYVYKRQQYVQGRLLHM